MQVSLARAAVVAMAFAVAGAAAGWLFGWGTKALMAAACSG